MSHNSPDVQAINQSLIKYAADSLTAASRHSEAERKALGEAVTDAMRAFLPNDPLQTILASEAVGFHLSILDGFREVSTLPMTQAQSARARMVSVAQTKMVLALVRELRLARKGNVATVEAQPTAAPDTVRDDTAFNVNLNEFQTAYTQALETLEAEAGPLAPETADRAQAALEQAVAPAQSPPAQMTGSRAHRRAVMKRQGAFRKAS